MALLIVYRYMESSQESLYHVKLCCANFLASRRATNHSPGGFKVSFLGEILIAHLKNQALDIFIKSAFAPSTIKHEA